MPKSAYKKSNGEIKKKKFNLYEQIEKNMTVVIKMKKGIVERVTIKDIFEEKR